MSWQCWGIPPLVEPCGASGTEDSGADKHTRATKHSTGPETGCHITRTVKLAPGEKRPRCGEPVAERGLCAKHLADYVRLGGAL